MKKRIDIDTTSHTKIQRKYFWWLLSSRNRNRRWGDETLSCCHILYVFLSVNGLLVCMLWCSWPSWWMSFWVKGHMSQSKRWFKLGVSLSKFPEWMRCHLCSSTYLRKFVIESRWKKQIHIHLQVNDFLTPIYSLTICLVAMSFKGTKRPSNMEHFIEFFPLKNPLQIVLQQRKIKTLRIVQEVLVQFLKKSRVELQ